MDTSSITIDVLERRILPKIRNAKSGCWEWTASTNGTGYARWTEGMDKPSWRVHKLMYQLTTGEVLPRTKKATDVIDHICNNKLCVRPSHLQRITQRENVMRNPKHSGNRVGYHVGGHEPDIYITRKKQPTGLYTECKNCRTCNRLFNNDHARWKELRKKYLADEGVF